MMTTEPWVPPYRGPKSTIHRLADPVPVSRKGRRGKPKPVTRAAGCEGKRIEATRVVDDPYAIEPGTKMTARVNVAEHPLEWMLARGRLQAAHYEAGVKFRAIYARAEIGGAKAMDLSKVKVDGGGAGDPLAEGVAEAHRDLSRIYAALGAVHGRIVELVCGQGLSVTEVSERWGGGWAPLMVRNHISISLIEGLETLATEVWGARGGAGRAPAHFGGRWGAAPPRTARGFGGDEEVAEGLSVASGRVEALLGAVRRGTKTVDG